MRPVRLRGAWKFLLALYLVSFALPIDEGRGVSAFVVTLFWGLNSPVVWLFWAANPLFWFGISSLRGGRPAAAAGLGCAACTCAFLPIPLMFWDTMVSTPSALPKLAGYFAWFASTLGLAVVGLVDWLGARPQVRIRALMVLVLVIALALALFPTMIRALRGLLTLPGA